MEEGVAILQSPPGLADVYCAPPRCDGAGGDDRCSEAKSPPFLRRAVLYL